jgi:molybdopterin converting factor small subunit
VRITVRWFAQLREQRGCSEEPLDVPAGSTVETVLATLALPAGLRVAVAVNAQLVERGAALREGDELAVLPPIGGG